MKLKKLIIVMVLCLVLVMLFAGCKNKEDNVIIDGLEFGKVYRQVIYDSREDKFITTNNSVEIYEDYKYKETLFMGDNSRVLEGDYVMDAPRNLVFLQSGNTSFEKFKRDYRNYLKAQGFTISDIDNLIIPSIANNVEFYYHNNYMFKLTGVNASRVGDANDVANVDGLYNFNRILGEKSMSKMYLKDSIIYKVDRNDFGEDVIETTPEKKIGNYYVSADGNFITIEPTVALNGGEISKPMKYLLADMILPMTADSGIDGKVDRNQVITIYENVKIKVIVGSFYTTDEL